METIKEVLSAQDVGSIIEHNGRYLSVVRVSKTGTEVLDTGWTQKEYCDFLLECQRAAGLMSLASRHQSVEVQYTESM